MSVEIEHKYLVQNELWKKIIPEKSVNIKQSYLLVSPEKTIRIRTMENKGYITIKGKSTNASRLEFEYEIPLNDAIDLINNFSLNVIEKIRHDVVHKSKIWVVDEFKGSNEGLFVAEIELTTEKEEYSLPDWVGMNITNDLRYTNANLFIRPYSTW